MIQCSLCSKTFPFADAILDDLNLSVCAKCRKLSKATLGDKKILAVCDLVSYAQVILR